MNIRSLVIALSSLLSCYVLSAQQARYDYVDLNMQSVSPDQAAFRRAAVLQEDGFFHVVVRFLDGQTRMTGTYADEALQVQEGWFEYFFFGGQMESMGAYQNGIKVGLWKRWNWNGQSLPDRHYAAAEPVLQDCAAEFPGGHSALQTYIRTNLEYPEAARKRRIEGEVQVAFSIDPSGSIHSIEILSSTHPLLSDAGFELVANMPRWQPAIKRGTAISSHFILPITFELSVTQQP